MDPVSTISHQRQLSSPTILQGVRLHLARLAWLAITLLALGLFIAGLPARYKEIQNFYQGNIQADLLQDQAGGYTLSIGSGSTAAGAGALDRDVLVAVDNTPIAGLSQDQIYGLLGGPVGSSVRLSIRTGDFPVRQVVVTRENPQGRILQQFGLTSDFAAFFVLASEIIFTILCLVVAFVIFKHRSTDWMALLASLVLTMILVGLSLPVTNQGQNLTFSLLDVWFALAFGLMLLFFYLFPSGQFVPRGALLLAGLLALWTLAEPFQPQLYPWFQPRQTFGWIMIAWSATGALALVYRYRYHSDDVERRQIRWVVLGGIGSVVGVLIQVVPLPYRFAGWTRVLFDFGFFPLGQLLKAMLPLSITLAVLRYRLWDINLVINRVLVYTSVSGITMLLYLGAVALLGSIFKGLADQVAFFLATGLVALLFEPLRQRMQRLVNRLMYGERDDPYRVLTRLAQRMEAAIEPASALPLTVETVAHTLKLPYVAITLKQGEEFKKVAAFGEIQNRTARFPLVHAGEVMGELVAAARAGEETITAADQRLLSDLARQISVTAHAVLLSADLERARLHIVEAREEARRRLGSDLHDGVGHQLAGLARQAERARVLMADDPDAAQSLLSEIKTQLDRSILQVRQLAHQLYPPELELLGLVGALQERLESSTDVNLLIRADLPEKIPALPTAIESAAYYITLEALTNISRHAGARSCTLRLRFKDNSEDLPAPMLDLEICDDGRGLSSTSVHGLGLLSMQARAAEVGGTCVFDANPGGGTCVTVRLPYPNQEV